ncbi:MAG: SAM-dependent DNA methyltransferase, partial [Synergistales bacterium]|nr:SAM-dependent DNA methyltransferase [Synergistales bacterium]
WILSNRKRPEHKGKVVLLDARDQWVKMRKSLGDKRKEIDDKQITQITRWYADALEIAAEPDADTPPRVKVFPTTAFGYQRITVERPLRLRFEVTDDAVAALQTSKPFRALAPDAGERLLEAMESLRDADGATRAGFDRALTAALSEHGVTVGAPLLKALWAAVSVPDPEGELQTDRKGNPLPDPDLRDNENVPLGEDTDEYLAREVLPHVPDAWIDHTKTKIGYEIPFTRHFYVYTPPRALAEIDLELKELETEIRRLLGEVAS